MWEESTPTPGGEGECCEFAHRVMLCPILLCNCGVSTLNIAMDIVYFKGRELRGMGLFPPPPPPGPLLCNGD